MEGPKESLRQIGGSTVEQLRSDIDHGRTGDKVRGPTRQRLRSVLMKRRLAHRSRPGLLVQLGTRNAEDRLVQERREPWERHGY
jgi:hypothetical protein